ncbi:hypothetical protein DM02DRAFT_605940 [Periconia macrospinosa]|uniref:Zn(2)-C6 fungal-type domain-containing protein n=1 Tax=Periconia macrospinosa TaxID=97972 RepID=A0A2V1D1R3_9PLEO|nr:hypothetical protein DM02DRAFT_605940 [Periconia macrospinosa]
MAEQVPGGVLWCNQCNKPFTKQLALKRHGYYCRSNTKAPTPVSRRRSCAACVKAKTGCNNALPACSRCSQRGITCQYPSKPTTKRRDAGETRRGNTIIPTVTEQAHSLADMTPTGDSPMLFNEMQWNFDDPLLPDTTDQAFREQSQLNRHHSPQLLNVSISPAPSLTVRSMVQRPKMHPGEERAASLIFYTLKSYPLMLRQHTLPPFIHPEYVSFTDEGTTTESLDNCITLMHMASGGQGSRKLFWRNVRQECERLWDQNERLGKWELLGAMQALSIYVLIRLDEGETEHNNLDYLLENAVILIAMQLSHHDFDCPTPHVPCHSKSESNWQDWVYKESRRRLAVIYRILNKLIYFSPAAMCEMPAEFVIAPLPAKRQLWEARNAQEWKVQRGKDLQEQLFALAVDGEIVKLEQRRLSCRDAWLPYAPSDEGAAFQNRNGRYSHVAGCWAEWCSGMDSMSSLIMLAATMT